MSLAPDLCLILCAYRVVAGAPLIVAANRDEYFARGTTPIMDRSVRRKGVVQIQRDIDLLPPFTESYPS